MDAAGALIAYAICRHCAAVFPAERRCPACDRDEASAAAIAAATAHAVEPASRHLARFTPPAPRRAGLLVPIVGVAALMLGIGVGVAWLVVDRAHPPAAAQIVPEE